VVIGSYYKDRRKCKPIRRPAFFIKYLYRTIFDNKICLEWVGKWLLLIANSAIFQLYHGENKDNFQWDDDEVLFVLDQHAEFDFYSASSLKQQSVGRYVAPLGHIIMIPSQSVFALSPYCCVISGEVTNTNFIVCGLTRPGLESTI
jgi:hypothetical protein